MENHAGILLCEQGLSWRFLVFNTKRGWGIKKKDRGLFIGKVMQFVAHGPPVMSSSYITIGCQRNCVWIFPLRLKLNEYIEYILYSMVCSL